MSEDFATNVTWYSTMMAQRAATTNLLHQSLRKFFRTPTTDNLYIASNTPATIPNTYDVWFVTVIPLVENPVQWDLVFYADSGRLLERKRSQQATLHIGYNDVKKEYFIDITEPTNNDNAGKWRTRKFGSYEYWMDANQAAYDYIYEQAGLGHVTIVHDHSGRN
jgi:hypothetical protein